MFGLGLATKVYVAVEAVVAESSMRPVALGRKNWLHVGSAKSGSKVAAILSVVESCRRLQVPIKEYLLTVLPGISRRKHSEAARLTPARYFSSTKGITLEDDTPCAY